MQVGSKENSRPSFPPPFDEPVYTVAEAAAILKWSTNQTAEMFRDEPGVRDLSNFDGEKKRYRKRRYRQLRIPHSVLVRVWNRTEIQKGGAA